MKTVLLYVGIGLCLHKRVVSLLQHNQAPKLVGYVKNDLIAELDSMNLVGTNQQKRYIFNTSSS